jgi:hypothetical protein
VNRQGAQEQHGLAAPRVERVARLGKTSVHVRHRSIELIENDAARAEPGEHLPDLAAVERGHEQAECGRREHHSRCEREQSVEQALGGPADDEERKPAQAGGKARPDHPGEGVPIHWVVWEPRSAQDERRRHVAERAACVEARRRAVLDEPLCDPGHAAELHRPVSARSDHDGSAVGQLARRVGDVRD